MTDGTLTDAPAYQLSTLFIFFFYFLQWSLLTCSLIFICFFKKQMVLVKINLVIYFSLSHLLFAETNEDRTTSRKALFFFHFLQSVQERKMLPGQSERVMPLGIMEAQLSPSLKPFDTIVL